MTRQLHIAKNLSLPIDFVTTTHAILGKKRTGKSYKASVLAEEMLDADQQIVVLDPTSAWWGLRSSASGKRAGYPITIFGGEHQDLALDPTAGEAIADAIVNERFSAILDLSLMTKGEEQRFCGEFLERLYRKNKRAMHLFLDEADIYAPQKPFGDEARTLGACQSIVLRGGIRGIGITMITQRPARLNKDVLSQADMLTCLGMNHPRDLDAIDEWVSVHGDLEKSKELRASLPSLPKGDAWLWWPARDIYKRVTFRDRETFDSGRTPMAGEKIKPPKKLAPIDLKRLGESLARSAEEAKASSVPLLKGKIAHLEAELKKVNEKLTSSSVKPEKVNSKPAKLIDTKKLNKLIDRLEKLGGAWDARATALHDAATKAENVTAKVRAEASSLRVSELANPKPIAAREVGKPDRRQAVQRQDDKTKKALREIYPATHTNGVKLNGTSLGNSGLRRMLIALAQRDGLTNQQLGVRAGLSSKSGTFGTYLGKARSEGWITDQGDKRHITNAGIESLGQYEPLPTGRALAEFWLGELGNSGAARMLRVLIDAYPGELMSEQLGQLAGISHKSGTFGTYLGKLRTLELITGGRGVNRASEELFE